jgi:hypothetical protein
MITTRVNAWLGVFYRVLTGMPNPQGQQRDGELLLCLLAITCLAFGFELSNPTLGIDDYSHLNMNFEWHPFWIARGMWGGLLLQYLLPGGWITPFIELLIGIVIQCLTALMLGWLLLLHRLTYGQRFIACALFTTFPFFAAQLAFSYMQIAYPLAAGLCIAGLLLARTNSTGRFVVGCLVIAFALSIYQGCISVLITAAALYPVFAWADVKHGSARSCKEHVAIFIRMGCAVLVAAALYILAHKAILAYTGLPAGEGYYSVSFDLAFWQRWDNIISTSVYLLSGSEGLIPYRAQLLFLLVLGFVITRLVLSGGHRTYLPALLAVMTGLALLLLTPFFMLLLHAGSLAPRSAMGVGVLWVAAWALAQEFSAGKVAKYFVSGTALAVLVMFLFQNNRMFYSEYLVEQADMLTISRMAERIAMLDAQNGEENLKGIVILGNYSYPQTPAMVRYCDSVLGYSMFEWDTENPHYAAATLAKIRGIEQYISYGPSVLQAHVDVMALVANRQPWPHADAVFLQDNFAVLWLGERRTGCGEGSFRDWLTRWLPGTTSS